MEGRSQIGIQNMQLTIPWKEIRIGMQFHTYEYTIMKAYIYKNICSIVGNDVMMDV